MTYVDTLVTVGILLFIIVIIYLRLTNQTLVDFFKEIRDIMTMPIGGTDAK